MLLIWALILCETWIPSLESHFILGKFSLRGAARRVPRCRLGGGGRCHGDITRRALLLPVARTSGLRAGASAEIPGLWWEALPGPSGGPRVGDGAPCQVPRPDRDGSGRGRGAGLPRPHQVGAPPPPLPFRGEGTGDRGKRSGHAVPRRPGSARCRHRARPSGSRTTSRPRRPEAPPGAGPTSSSQPEASAGGCTGVGSLQPPCQGGGAAWKAAGVPSEWGVRLTADLPG